VALAARPRALSRQRRQKGAITMLLCILCHFEEPLDDAVLTWPDGACLCLRCFGRETNSSRRMPKKLRRELIATLAELEVA
jgi:hypothetical protein